MNTSPRGRPRTRFALVAGFLLLALPVARAQDAPSPSSSRDAEKPAEVPMRPNTNSYAVSLGTGELINMGGQQGPGNASSGEPPSSLTEYDDGLRVSLRNKEFKGQFFYGLSVGSAYASDYSGAEVSSHELNTLVPYLAVLVPTKTGSYVLQYSAVVNPDDASVQGGGATAYHSASATAQGAFNRRWYWSFKADGSYGSEAARVEGPLTFLVMQNMPVADASASVRLPATNVLYVDNTARLTFQKSPRDSIGVELGEAYSDIQSNAGASTAGLSSSSLELTADYTRALSGRLSLLGYGDAGTLVTGADCYTYGGGVGFSAAFSHRVRLEARGGPQRTSPGCGRFQPGNFSAVISANVNARDRVYATASRTFSSAYQVNGAGQDTYAAGFVKGLGRFDFMADAGYIREALVAAPPYKGYFVAPRLQCKISKSVGFTVGYRDLHVSGGNLAKGNLNYAVVSLDWHPAGLHFK